MLISLRPVLLAVILFTAIMGALVPSARAQTPLRTGTLVDTTIKFQFGIYYPVPPAKEPIGVVRRLLASSGTDMPKLAASLSAVAREPTVAASWNTNAQKEYHPPGMALLQRFGHGLSREQAQALEKADQVLILDFTHPSSHSGRSLRAALKLTEQTARETQGLIWDEETRETFTPDTWHKRRLEGWSADIPDIWKHTVIHAYQSGSFARAITLGMAKFGLPDVVVSDFSWSLNKPVGNLIVAFSQAMAEGATLSKPGIFDLNFRSIQHLDVRQLQASLLKAKTVPIARLAVVTGRWESGDPRNRLIDIGADRYPGSDRSARLASMLDELYGTEDPVRKLKNTDELLAASNAAVAKLPQLREAFLRGLQPGELIQVKAPFATTSNGREFMWVEVTAWSGDVIDGMLRNEPVDVPNLHGGQMVKVSQRQIFDYIRQYPNGRQEGNETGKIIERMQPGR